MINVGLIGYGMSAQTFHLPLILANGNFKLCAISTSKSDLVSEKYPNVSIYNCANDLINDALLDLVIITAPNDVHYNLAKSSLLNNLHVIIEKPMTTTSVQAIELVEIAKKRELLLSVFHNRRWDGDFLTIQKLLTSKVLGDLRIFESHFDRFRPCVGQKWKENEGVATGVWYDLGSHLVDQSLLLFGLPKTITATCLSLRENSEAIDYFHVQLHYDNLEVILHSSPFAAGSNIRFDLQGSNGRFIKQGLDCQEEQLKQGMLPTEIKFGEEHEKYYGIFYSELENKVIPTEQGCYQYYYEAIAEAINTRNLNPVTGNDGLHVIKILELALLSSKQKQTLTYK